MSYRPFRVDIRERNYRSGDPLKRVSLGPWMVSFWARTRAEATVPLHSTESRVVYVPPTKAQQRNLTKSRAKSDREGLEAVELEARTDNELQRNGVEPTRKSRGET